MVKKYPAMKQQYRNVVSNEEVAKALAATKLGPAIAVARGSEDFFDEFYNKLFTSETSTASALAPTIIYWLVKDTYPASQRFHSFKKAFVFKNPAGYYVTKSIYDAISKTKDWEKKYVSFYENSEERKWNRFFNTVKKTVSEYFEITYDSWRQSGQPDHRSYLQNSQTIKEIKRQYGRRMQILSGKTKKVFKDYVF